MRRNKFSLSHYKLLSAHMGRLVPLTWFEALPGDSIQQATSLLIRMKPMLAPIMHPVRVRIHHWFVPNRLLWEDWEDFITGGPEGISAPEWPHFEIADTTQGYLEDYMGLPPGTYDPAVSASALPFRAYQLIWSEHYRDQDLEVVPDISTASGLDTSTSTELRRVSWEKDYFTTARPWEQKGNRMLAPLTGYAPIKGIGVGSTSYPNTNVSVYETRVAPAQTYAESNSTNIHVEKDTAQGYANGRPAIFADFDNTPGGGGLDINDLRFALAMQRYQEARARYGSRYVEYLRYLGVRSSDARLQSPEYLGGGRQVIQFSEVLQTAPDATSQTVVGEMKGHGITAMRTNRYRRFFEEHGVVMTLMSVVPKSMYMHSMHKMFSRMYKEDYFQKELQHIGEQEVLNKEVFMPHTDPDEVFGYQARYDEYRHIPSTVSSEFRNELKHWHMAREFSVDPALNSTFVRCAPTDRIYADTNLQPLIIMSNHSIQARRMMSKYATPRII